MSANLIYRSFDVARSIRQVASQAEFSYSWSFAQVPKRFCFKQQIGCHEGDLVYWLHVAMSALQFGSHSSTRLRVTGVMEGPGPLVIMCMSHAVRLQPNR